MMGIVNATPDSFSDAGVHRTVEDRVTLARELRGAGADIIDVGGESGVTNRPAVDPREVYLFGRLASEMDAPRSFLQQLEGVIKYSISRLEGSVDLPRAAAALGHRVAAIRLGVDYWAGRGALTVVEERDTYVLLREGGKAREGVRAAAEEALKSVLSETAAYRRHFQRAPTGRLL